MPRDTGVWTVECKEEQPAHSTPHSSHHQHPHRNSIIGTSGGSSSGINNNNNNSSSSLNNSTNSSLTSSSDSNNNNNNNNNHNNPNSPTVEPNSSNAEPTNPDTHSPHTNATNNNNNNNPDNSTGTGTEHKVVYRCRALVCADGAASRLARSLGVVFSEPTAVCSRSYVQPPHAFKWDGMLFYPPSLLPGCCAIVRLAGGELNYLTFINPSMGGQVCPSLTSFIPHSIKLLTYKKRSC